MAFFTTNPINIIKPSKANKLKLLNDKFSAKNAPITATGIENKTTNGYTKLSYSATIIR